MKWTCVSCRADKDWTDYLAAEGMQSGRMDECKACYLRRDVRRLSPSELDELIARGKNRPCMDCGGSFPPVAMDYDHVPERGRKLFNLSAVPKSADAVMVRREMSKCDIICANCHRVRTSGRAGTNKRNALQKLKTTLKKNRYLHEMIVADKANGR